MLICCKYGIWNYLRVIPATEVGEQMDSYPMLETPIEQCCAPYPSPRQARLHLGEYQVSVPGGISKLG